jgi:hypothetical protein
MRNRDGHELDPWSRSRARDEPRLEDSPFFKSREASVADDVRPREDPERRVEG